ncbi:ABC transporter substrate-binding protein [Paenibacillus sp. KS-LC4]|uniref:ABC transporter substrate-binding protein n=1 Tax=Paenibacillus sp. KS-LC4 TaxID=2979727 RepID=UPI0030CC4183
MFRPQAFYKIACLAMLALAVFLAGCANQETVEQVEDAAQTPVTRMINTSIGEIEIPAQPERIIVDWNIGHVLAVGVTPIGVPQSLLDYGEFMRKPLENTEDIGDHNQVSLEKMVALEPDLIITWNKDAYDSYSKIAPTVAFVPDEYASMEEEVTAMGEILNRQTEAEAWNEQFTRRAEAARKKSTGGRTDWLHLYNSRF